AASSRVVLQGFWWDYWNNRYPSNWSTYLADLAPRLRELGIDAVWIPPTIKNKNATGSVGYAPFDHYDLGDKFQGGATATRMGTKDDLLRAVAVLHANGIEVIQDVVWNHMNGAGSQTGAGGSDPVAPGNKFKTFRYSAWVTPALAEDAANYGARRGRFPKNWQNFHPNPDHNSNSDDISGEWFGPDICYWRGAIGQSSISSYNPPQALDYMRNQMRAWSIWLKKQTGVDGFRIDAVKHFEPWVTKDFIWNLAFNAGFASGGADMYAVGEFIGSKDQIDSWVDAANNSDGFTDVVGTFDVSLRSALKSMIDSQGSFDIGSIPSAQQNRRSRTAPFVNSHDTFRPRLSSSGNYIGWDTANELGGHVEPGDARIQAAYAVICAVDGSPTIFFEDLFDIGTTGKRWTHSPTNRVDLPAREWLANLLWCHRNLRFKQGAYKVRWQGQDLLVIERSARALVGINDSWNQWQSANVQTDFGPNVVLRDYSSANATEARTDASGRFIMRVPPCDGSNPRRGYSVWAPVEWIAPAPRPSRTTTQEWEMADDLGDSHNSSLRQGGALPANSTALRNVGRIWPAAGEPMRVDVFLQRSGNEVEFRLVHPTGKIESARGAANFTFNTTPDRMGYHLLQLRNTTTANDAQTVWVKVNYTGVTDLHATIPTIVQAPQNQAVVVGSDVTLRVEASARPAPSLQWTRHGLAIPNATNSVLTLSNVRMEDAGEYAVRITNEAGVITTQPVEVLVHAMASARLRAVRAGESAIQIEVMEQMGLRYVVERSSDFVDWLPIRTNAAPFAITESIGNDRLFYRARFQE
ncbi:MAG: alpha-amylase domain-containing protein, partial [Verrucomicrobiota bacterium]